MDEVSKIAHSVKTRLEVLQQGNQAALEHKVSSTLHNMASDCTVHVRQVRPWTLVEEQWVMLSQLLRGVIIQFTADKALLLYCNSALCWSAGVHLYCCAKCCYIAFCCTTGPELYSCVSSQSNQYVYLGS